MPGWLPPQAVWPNSPFPVCYTANLSPGNHAPPQLPIDQKQISNPPDIIEQETLNEPVNEKGIHVF